MKNISLFLFAIALASCNCSAPANDSSKDTAAVIQTDKDFNDYAAKHGQGAAFILFADSSMVQMNQNELPTVGIAALRAVFAKQHDTVSKLTWTPERGEASGNIGYTYGWWKFRTKTKAGSDTIYQGVYVTVWKRQKDGSWKYVLDGGNDTPAPKNN